MHVCINAARRHNEAFASNNLRARAHNHVLSHVHHRVGVASGTDTRNMAILDTDVGLDDTRVVHNERVRNDRIKHISGSPS